MKQAVKKDSTVKASTQKTTSATKVNKANKNELHLQKENRINRFLEASCDCV
ncbi:MAG: hypothetical protein V3U89_09375 [Methylophilaceae bacterium]